MKRFLFAASAAAMMMASCSDDVSDRFASSGGSEELIRIYASIFNETKENSRTSLGALTDTGFPYKWDDADAIGVFPVSEDGEAVPATNAIFKYDAANKEPGKTAFLGTPQILRYDDIWAYYPWSANTTVKNGYIIELNIRPFQNYNFSAVPESADNSGNNNGNLIPNGSFGQSEAPSVAWGSLSMEDDNSYTFDLEFFPLAGYLAIPVIGESKVSTVAITVCVGEGSNAKYVQLAGKLNIDMSKGMESLGNPGFESGSETYATVNGNPTGDNGGMITVECGRGVQLDPETPTWFWFVVPANMPTTNDTHVNIYVDGTRKFTYTFNRAAGKTEVTRNMTLSLTDSQKAFEYTEEDDKEEELIIPEDMTIAFPDINFRKYVLDNFDKDKDGKISQKEALDVTKISCKPKNYSSEYIYSLEGIQYFTNLTYLYCSSNQLTTLDVSKNTALTELWYSSNQLTTLDVSKNTALTKLGCSSNQLTTLDVSKNTALISLSCDGNQLTTLDVSKNTALTELVCYSNQLTTLDVSKNTALTKLVCQSNQLTTLDVSNNIALKDLKCSSNQLTTLDVSKNTEMELLYCANNQLTTLDVSKNTALTDLACQSNQLTTLDVSKNTALTYLSCQSNQLTTLDVSNNNSVYDLYCNMESLKTLYLKTGKSIEGITYNRSTYYIHDNTKIEYK